MQHAANSDTDQLMSKEYTQRERECSRLKRRATKNHKQRGTPVFKLKKKTQKPKARKFMPTVPKPDLVQIKWILYDACSGHSNTQDVLLCGQVVWRRHPVYLHQVAARQGPAITSILII